MDNIYEIIDDNKKETLGILIRCSLFAISCSFSICYILGHPFRNAIIPEQSGIDKTPAVCESSRKCEAKRTPLYQNHQYKEEIE